MRRRCVHWDWWVDCDSECHTCEKRDGIRKGVITNE